MLEYANSESPKVGGAWASLDEEGRHHLAVDALSENSRFDMLRVVSARPDGQVFVASISPLAAGERGPLLRAAEAHLKDSVDPGLTIWCEPLGDKNSLRKLRGIQVVS